VSVRRRHRRPCSRTTALAVLGLRKRSTHRPGSRSAGHHLAARAVATLDREPDVQVRTASPTATQPWSPQP
jgi:hypothetical protein